MYVGNHFKSIILYKLNVLSTFQVFSDPSCHPWDLEIAKSHQNLKSHIRDNFGKKVISSSISIQNHFKSVMLYKSNVLSTLWVILVPICDFWAKEIAKSHENCQVPSKSQVPFSGQFWKKSNFMVHIHPKPL